MFTQESPRIAGNENKEKTPQKPERRREQRINPDASAGFFIGKELNDADKRVRDLTLEIARAQNWTIEPSLMEDQNARRKAMAEKLEQEKRKLDRISEIYAAFNERGDKEPLRDYVKEAISISEEELARVGEAAQKNIAEIRERNPEAAEEADAWTEDIRNLEARLEKTKNFPASERISAALKLARNNFEQTEIGRALEPVRKTEFKISKLKTIEDSMAASSSS